jgi:hypothetical protein
VTIDDILRRKFFAEVGSVPELARIAVERGVSATQEEVWAMIKGLVQERNYKKFPVPDEVALDMVIGHMNAIRGHPRKSAGEH